MLSWCSTTDAGRFTPTVLLLLHSKHYTPSNNLLNMHSAKLFYYTTVPLLLIYRRIQAPQLATILFPVLFSVRCTCTISFQQNRTTYFSVTITPVTNMFSITSLHHHNRALLQNIENFSTGVVTALEKQNLQPRGYGVILAIALLLHLTLIPHLKIGSSQPKDFL